MQQQVGCIEKSWWAKAWHSAHVFSMQCIDQESPFSQATSILSQLTSRPTKTEKEDCEFISIKSKVSIRDVRSIFVIQAKGLENCPDYRLWKWEKVPHFSYGFTPKNHRSILFSVDDTIYEVPKENAVLPAAPRPAGIALFLTGFGSVFRMIELRSSCQKRRSPPTSGTIPFGRACLADGEKIC